MRQTIIIFVLVLLMFINYLVTSDRQERSKSELKLLIHKSDSLLNEVMDLKTSLANYERTKSVLNITPTFEVDPITGVELNPYLIGPVFGHQLDPRQRIMVDSIYRSRLPRTEIKSARNSARNKGTDIK